MSEGYPRWLVRACCVLSILTMGLGIAMAMLLSRFPSVRSARSTDDLTATERQEIVRHMVQDSEGIWDTFPDAEVGRLLQPGIRGKRDQGVEIRSNRFGLREREYELPKPAHTLRVVLLGDSFVFGMGVEAEDRLGVHLERALTERAEDLGMRTVEVLHVGLGSWNIRAECAYLRRQLTVLDPDLVIHVLVPNDLDDMMGTRGFGALTDLDPHHPDHADGVVLTSRQRALFGRATRSWIPLGLGYESERRFVEASQAIERLVLLLRERGTPYLQVLYWISAQPVAQLYFGSRRQQDEVTYIKSEFFLDPRYRLADGHWNPLGHERVAELLYWMIRKGSLLRDVTLPDWGRARAAFEELHLPGEQEAHSWRPQAGFAFPPMPLTRISFDGQESIQMGSQVHGGIDSTGRVSPHATVLLALQGGTRLTLEGSTPDYLELAGNRLHVKLDMHTVGAIDLQPGASFRQAFEIPPSLRSNHVVTVTLSAEDFAYEGNDLRRCVVCRLRSVAIEN